MREEKSYLEILREESTTPSEALPFSSRLLTTTTTTPTTTTTENSTTAPATRPQAATIAEGDPPNERPTAGFLGERGEKGESGPTWADASGKVRGKSGESPPARPAADVAGDLGRPAADVARTPAEWPARPVPDWRTIDPHDYQPRPFGPMETDPDWVDPDGAADADDARAAGRASGSPAGHAKGRASDPWAEEDEEVCWNCGQEVEFFSPGGRAWCSFCLEGEPDADWRDLVALLPSRWPRPREEPRHLAVFAASACHEAGRPNYAVSWPWSPFLEVRSAKALFHQLGDLLRSPEAWRRRTAEAILGEIAASEGMNARLPGHPRPPAGSIIPPHPVAD